MDGYKVRRVENEIATRWVLDKHYAHRLPQMSFVYGLFYETELVGICTFGRPGGACLSKGIFGGEFIKRIWELNRLFLLHNKKNEASYFIGQCLKLLPSPSCIVSFADSSVNHAGYVYQATNWIYTGLSAKRTEWVIEGMEHLHSKSIADKAKKGGGRWESLKEQYGDKLGKRDRPSKHRYVYFIGSKKEKREMENLLKYKKKNYPKTKNENYEIKEVETTQLDIFGQ